MLNQNDITNPIKLKLTACRTRETEEAEKFLGLDQAYKRARLAISDSVSLAIFFHREVSMCFELLRERWGGVGVCPRQPVQRGGRDEREGCSPPSRPPLAPGKHASRYPFEGHSGRGARRIPETSDRLRGQHILGGSSFTKSRHRTENN